MHRADADLSDADQVASDADEAGASIDQRASDRDQAVSDVRRADWTADERSEHERALSASTVERRAAGSQRAATARDRLNNASARRAAADRRNDASQRRETELIDVRAELAAHRAEATEAAADAAAALAEAERVRAVLEAELRSSHLDSLTGAYRREMGETTIAQEIERARRSWTSLVVAYIDVDDLKLVNDRDGHAAGDRVLQAVARQLRLRLRPFDSVIRYGGDEFVCVLGGAGLPEAERRFGSIGSAIEAEAGVSISVGLASLTTTDNAEQLIDRADAAMLEIKRRHHSA